LGKNLPSTASIFTGSKQNTIILLRSFAVFFKTGNWSRGGAIMKSGTSQQSSASIPAVSNGGADLRGAVLRMKRDDAFAMAFTKDEVEIALSAAAVAEIRASLTTPPRFRDYRTVAQEAGRIALSEKTLRMLLKERHAPHYVLGSDIRIDPVALDEWLDANYHVGNVPMNSSLNRGK
jgi:excisionase family DNA binding protein